MSIKPEQCIVCFDNETELYKCDRCSAYMCNKCKIWLQNEKNNTCLQCNLKPFNQTIDIQVEETENLEPVIISRDEHIIRCLGFSIDVHDRKFKKFAWALIIYMIISGIAQIVLWSNEITKKS